MGLYTTLKVYANSIAVLFILQFTISTSYSQGISNDIIFANHLTVSQRYSESIFLLKNTISNNKYICTQSQMDSIHYLIGWNYYMEKQQEDAIQYFLKVHNLSTWHLKSIFYASFLKANLGEYSQADSLLESVTVLDSNFTKLKNYQQAAYSLLKMDYFNYDKRKELFKNDFYPTAAGEIRLEEYKDKLLHNKRKSPVVAGVLSAILPGAGKFYAGYKGQAAGGFLPSFFLGAVAVENYIKSGYDSPNFIIFASLFSAFYIGNIWGSVLSVKMKHDEINNEVKHNLLLDIHIPIRRLFN